MGSPRRVSLFNSPNACPSSYNSTVCFLFQNVYCASRKTYIRRTTRFQNRKLWERWNSRIWRSKVSTFSSRMLNWYCKRLAGKILNNRAPIRTALVPELQCNIRTAVQNFLRIFFFFWSKLTLYVWLDAWVASVVTLPYQAKLTETSTTSRLLTDRRSFTGKKNYFTKVDYSEKNFLQLLNIDTVYGIRWKIHLHGNQTRILDSSIFIHSRYYSLGTWTTVAKRDLYSMKVLLILRCTNEGLNSSEGKLLTCGFIAYT